MKLKESEDWDEIYKLLLFYSPYNDQLWCQYLDYKLKCEITLILDEIYIPIVKCPSRRKIKAIVIKLSVLLCNVDNENI